MPGFYGCKRYPSCTGYQKALARSVVVPCEPALTLKSLLGGPKCRDCGAMMNKRTSNAPARRQKLGFFWGCGRFPKCKAAILPWEQGLESLRGDVLAVLLQSGLLSPTLVAALDEKTEQPVPPSDGVLGRGRVALPGTPAPAFLVAAVTPTEAAANLVAEFRIKFATFIRQAYSEECYPIANAPTATLGEQKYSPPKITPTKREGSATSTGTSPLASLNVPTTAPTLHADTDADTVAMFERQSRELHTLHSNFAQENSRRMLKQYATVQAVQKRHAHEVSVVLAQRSERVLASSSYCAPADGLIDGPKS
jgi:hypothetical protein